jgi:5-methyltetrahydrofolate--homocysteine methyltransferase
MKTTLKSDTQTVQIGPDQPFVIIGEKLNPTGHKKMATALQERNFDYVVELAKQQAGYGADVLDVNVGVPGLDDVALLPEIARLVSEAAALPICLDSPNPAALAAALPAITGKPLINSVSGENARLEAVLPLVKEHGAAVIGLVMDDHGIPSTPEARLAVAEKIMERAARLGIPAEDVVIDPLVMAIGSDTSAGMVTLQTIALFREKLGANVVLGASNVSFGLPDRGSVNVAFLTMAMLAGATCAITDPCKMVSAIRAADLVLGRDEFAVRYIKNFRKLEKLQAGAQ